MDDFVGHGLWRFSGADGCQYFDGLACAQGNVTDIRRQILKICHERFITKGRFSRAPPPTNCKDSASAEGASGEKLAVLW